MSRDSWAPIYIIVLINFYGLIQSKKNLILKIDKNNTIREKTKKASKHQRHGRYDIRGKITKIKHKVCYEMITEVMHLREDVNIIEKIRLIYD